MHQSRYLLPLTMCLLLTSAVPIGTAATFSCPAGDTACLIAAMHRANSTPELDTIQLAAGTYTLTAVNHTTVDGPNGLPLITGPLTIAGVTADTTIIARNPQAPSFRLLQVAATGILTLQQVTLIGGSAVSLAQEVGESFGGGLLNTGGRVDLVQCRVTGHRSGAHPTWDGYGGGVANTGSMTITDSLVTNNTAAGEFAASGAGGGVYNSGEMTMTESLIADNVAAGHAAGIYSTGTLTLHRSTVHGNILG